MTKIDDLEKRINSGENIVIQPDGVVRDMTQEEIDLREEEEKKARGKSVQKLRKPILCLDFDGVIHSYTSGWKGADVIPDPPVEGAIAFMLGALNHFQVCIFSSRSNQKGGLSAMKTWLKQHAGNCWWESPAGPGLKDVTFPTEKPSAMVTINDRAITFTGTWPTMDALLSFKPWNK